LTAEPPLPSLSKAARDYLLALVVFAVAFLLRIALDNVVPDQLPYVSFFPAVVVAAYWCGLVPSVLVLLLSAVAGTAWMEPSPGTGAWTTRLTAAFLFVSFSGVLVYLVHSLKEARARAERHEAQLALINRELKHRIKNLFSIAASICHQTIRTGRPANEMMEAVNGRIRAIASAQDLLSVTSREGADLSLLIESLVRPLAPVPARLKASGPAVALPPKASTPFALILHELSTNALKYGAWSRHGDVVVDWTVLGEKLHFEWREVDGPAVAPPPRVGLGTVLIKTGLPSATVEHVLKPHGLECRITLPI